MSETDSVDFTRECRRVLKLTTPFKERYSKDKERELVFKEENSVERQLDRLDFKSQNCSGFYNQSGSFLVLTRMKKKYTGSDLSLAAAATVKVTGSRGTFIRRQGGVFPINRH